MNRQSTGISFQERQRAVARHFQHVHKVCPYSGTAVLKDEIAYADLPHGASTAPEKHTQLLDTELNRFIADHRKKMLFLLMDEVFANHDEAHVTAKRLFFELMFRGMVVGQMPGLAPQSAELFRNRYRGVVDDPDLVLQSSSFGCRYTQAGEARPEAVVFAMAVNELYAPTHPRFSPSPALTLTKTTALQEIFSKNPEVGMEITMRAVFAVVSELYPNLRPEEVGEFIVNPRPKPGQLPITYRLHRSVDPKVVAAVEQQYKKSLYIYPPQFAALPQ